MVLSSTWFDPVLGMDVHILLIPMPPAPAPVPMPIPLPFTGMVLDPIGAAVGAAMGSSTVMINCCLATNCGTNVYNLPFHPPAPPAAKGKLDNDAELWFGGLNVDIGGSLAVRLGEIALSCSDPVRLPTSVVLAIPKGSIVFVPRPPCPDLMVIAISLAFKALGAAWKKFRDFQKASKWWEELAERMAQHIPGTGRAAQLFADALCYVTGHPVDVATGRVITTQIDLDLPGSLGLTFKRRYDSSASNRLDGVLGPGWAHPYDEALWKERGAIVYRLGDGRELEFSTLNLPDRVLSQGDSIYLPHARLTLRALKQFHFVIEEADGTTREFGPIRGGNNQVFHLVAIKSRLGDEQRFSYNERAQLEVATDPAGRRLHFTYDAKGRLVQVDAIGTSGAAKVVGVYRYDASGDLVQAQDALGHSFHYEYFNHLLVKETNKNGLSFYFQYDGVDSTAKCVRTWGDGGIYDHVITYAPDRSKTVVENSLGFPTLYELNSVGQVVKITDARGGTQGFEYDPITGQISKEIAADKATTTNEYDQRGNLTKVVRPDGVEIKLACNQFGQVTEVKDGIGATWSWGYDSSGRLIGKADASGATQQLHWDGSRITASTDARGQVVRFEHDLTGNLTGIVTADDAATRFGYDAFGLLTSIVDVNGNVQSFELDALGRVSRVRGVDGSERQLLRDPEGNIVQVSERGRDVLFEITGYNRVGARIEAGTRLEFSYDLEGQLVAIKNEHGTPYRFVRDPCGDAAEEYGFDELRRRYIRDGNGRVTSVHRPQGRSVKLGYDVAGRMISLEYHDGTKETFAYREDDLLVAATNANLEVKLERDAMGRIVKDTQGTDWVRSTFSSSGQRLTLESSRGAKQRIQRHAVNGAATGVEATGVAGAVFQAKFQRDLLGLEVERQLPGGIRSTWERDRLGRPTRQQVWQGSDMRAGRSYTWDADGRLSRIIDSMRGPKEFSHDALGYLATARAADGSAQLRVPDAIGNLFKTADRGDRVYGPAGQLLEARGPHGVTTYEYDTDGNLVKKVVPGGGVWAYRWTGGGMLAEVARPDGSVVNFQYDALGRRISKTYRGRTTRWIWDDNVILHEWCEQTGPVESEPPRLSRTAAYDGERALEALLAGRSAQGPPNEADPVSSVGSRGTAESPITWIFEPSSFAPLAKLVDGETFGIISDHLGAPLAMYDAAGREVWGGSLDIYGALDEERGAAGACPFRWPGQYEDSETGLSYNRFRYFDPDAGQYVSQDPIRLIGGLNLHAYAFDPNVDDDPFGLATNAQIGQTGESAVKDFLERNGFTDVRPMQNPSGHGIDFVARDPGGNLRVVEVKANGSRLSAAQSAGAHDFAESRAGRALRQDGPWKNATPEARLAAAEVQAEIDSGRKVLGLVARVEVDATTGEVKRIVLSIWRKC